MGAIADQRLRRGPPVVREHCPNHGAEDRCRDEQDSSRAIDPLRPAEDAVIVDSTALSFEETVKTIIRLTEECGHD